MCAGNQVIHFFDKRYFLVIIEEVLNIDGSRVHSCVAIYNPKYILLEER